MMMDSIELSFQAVLTFCQTNASDGLLLAVAGSTQILAIPHTGQSLNGLLTVTSTTFN
jgi:hypothetical protein